MVPAFRYQLLRAIDVSPEDIAEYKGNKIDDSMLRQLQKLFGFLELSERQAYDPVEFCFSFKDMDGNPTNTSLQQDAQEFLSIFFDRVEELLRPTSQKHLLEDIFGFKLCSQLIC
jgi:ubiquitin carboxyl-terminal hydrolase 34